jgi:Spy/CpxP family protein refolding chaperone
MRHTTRVDGIVSGVIFIAALGFAAGCDEPKSDNAKPAASASAAAAASSVAAVSPPAPTGAPQTVAADDGVNESLRDYHRHHHGGVPMFVSMAIDTLGLDDAKKAAVTKIQTDLRAKMAPVQDAEHALLSTIADGIAAGKIDTAKVDAAVEKVGAASAGAHDATADALTQLHDALSPAERTALVDKVKAHWDVWRSVNVDEKSGSKEKESRLGRLTQELTLTPAQVDKISAGLATEAPANAKTDPKAEDAHVQAFATAFLADKFDPKATAPSATASSGHVARHGGARLARFYETITPVLTPDQRTTLAAHIRERLDDDKS